MKLLCFGYLINSSSRIPNLQSAFSLTAVSLLINFICNFSQLLKINAFETANVLITGYDYPLFAHIKSFSTMQTAGK